MSSFLPYRNTETKLMSFWRHHQLVILTVYYVMKNITNFFFNWYVFECQVCLVFDIETSNFCFNWHLNDKFFFNWRLNVKLVFNWRSNVNFFLIGIWTSKFSSEDNVNIFFNCQICLFDIQMSNLSMFDIFACVYGLNVKFVHYVNYKQRNTIRHFVKKLKNLTFKCQITLPLKF